MSPRPKRTDPVEHIHLRLNEGVSKHVKKMAKKNNKSLSQQVEDLVREAAKKGSST